MGRRFRLLLLSRSWDGRREESEKQAVDSAQRWITCKLWRRTSGRWFPCDAGWPGAAMA